MPHIDWDFSFTLAAGLILARVVVGVATWLVGMAQRPGGGKTP